MIEPNNIGLFVGAVPVGLAFLNRVKNHIKARARNKSELSLSNEEPLEVAHLDHTRNEEYQDPSNGILVTQTEHLAHHLIHRGNAQAIGLTEEGNEWAIGQLFDRVFHFHRQRGVPDLYIQQRIDNAVQRWQGADNE